MNIRRYISMGVKTARISFLKQLIPFSILVLITNRCNRDCSYCNFVSRSRDDMATKDVLRLLKEAKMAGCERVGFSGGEPLLHEDFGEILAYAKELDLYTTIDSNGDFVASRIEDLKNLDIYVASLDGVSQNKHKGPKSFENQIEAVTLLRKRDIDVITCTVMTKHNCNVNLVDEMLRIAADLDIKVFFTIPMNLPHSTTGDTSELFAEHGEYLEVLRYITAKKKSNSRILNSNAFLKAMMQWPDFKQTFAINGYKMKGIGCYAAVGHCDIDTDCKVYPCFPYIGKNGGLDFREVGLVNAMKLAKKMCADCQACTLPAKFESNALFSLHPGTVINYMRKTNFMG